MKSKKAIKNKGGRPPKYETVKDLSDKIDLYFSSGMTYKDIVIDKKVVKKAVPTIAGLTLFLGFCDKSSLYEMEKDKRFSYLIKKAKLAIQRYHEENLTNSACTGSIFWLKNWADYKDKTEVEQNINLTETRIEFGNIELNDIDGTKENNTPKTSLGTIRNN